MYWLVAITSAFMIQIGNIYLANIVFVLWIIIRMFMGHGRFGFDKTNLHIYIFYISWILFSMLIFILQYGHFSTRNLVQFLFNIQYLLLIVDGTIDRGKLRHAMHICSLLLAITIIGLWIVKMGMMSIPTLIVHYRMWAEDYLGGWPNSTVLPLLFGIYMEMKAIMRERKVMGIARLGVLLVALLLCTSRTGYVGATLVIIYFLFTERESTKRWWKILKHAISIVMVVVVATSVISIITTNEMGGRMFMVADRMEIITDMLAYIGNRPISGYGGNSVDVVYEVVGRTVTGVNWGHTHNTILELLIRHGIIGMFAFALLVFRVSKRITSKEDRAMYWILWGISVLQIFYKDFIFLLLIYLLIPSKNDCFENVISDLKVEYKGKI